MFTIFFKRACFLFASSSPSKQLKPMKVSNLELVFTCTYGPMSFLNGKVNFFFLGFVFLILQQKVVIKLSLEGHKSRSKALKIAVRVSGVESVALKGDDRSQIEVTGDGMDPVLLTSLLRKTMRFAELLTVINLKPKIMRLRIE
ncbi:heavy metal-associated isoprenylated plant protein 16 isoform X1 [Citrus clementina]|uniref:heavy metal-associated isoprenylated plant protein 16 isoform X1 n=1 Tax=Citrus clementina TaxID=85681 RepID=UPI000CED6BF1|nr:heavy metal-associated isoprenylated plant protein 16 isoform X1 [Citrus x clementina]